jgi:16S rRNA (uracil1498-N3)-methyltransferase
LIGGSPIPMSSGIIVMAEERYFVIEPDSLRGDSAVLKGDEFHHLVRVVRAKAGREITLLDGSGGVYSAVVTRIGADEAELGIRSTSRIGPPPAVDIAIAALKAPRLDLAVEKCTEIGTRRLIVFSSRRSVWRAQERGAEQKRGRLERKVLAACKQSGQPFIPSVEPVVEFSSLLSMIPQYHMVYLADRQGTDVFHCRTPSPSEAILGVVGPEGGLADKERAELVGAGAVPVSLGSIRLRSETAAICLLFSLRALREPVIDTDRPR